MALGGSSLPLQGRLALQGLTHVRIYMLSSISWKISLWLTAASDGHHHGQQGFEPESSPSSSGSRKNLEYSVIHFHEVSNGTLAAALGGHDGRHSESSPPRPGSRKNLYALIHFMEDINYGTQQRPNTTSSTLNLPLQGLAQVRIYYILIPFQ